MHLRNGKKLSLSDGDTSAATDLCREDGGGKSERLSGGILAGTTRVDATARLEKPTGSEKGAQGKPGATRPLRTSKVKKSRSPRGAVVEREKGPALVRCSATDATPSARNRNENMNERGQSLPFACRFCNRRFETARGRGVHENSAHRLQRHEHIEKVSGACRLRRWSKEEQMLLAKHECELMKGRASRVNLVSRLAQVYTSATKSEIISARRSKRYKDIRSQILAAAQPIDKGPSEIEDKREGTISAAATQALEEALDGVQNLSECTSQVALDREFRRWLKGWHKSSFKKAPARGKEFPDRGSKRANKTGNRRVQRAKWLKAYEDFPARTARAILEGRGLEISSQFPTDTYRFWHSIFNGGQKSARARSAKPENWRELYDSLVVPFTSDEVGAHLKGMRQGARGPDKVTLSELRQVNPKELANWFNLFLLRGNFPCILKRFSTTLIPKMEGASRPGDFRPISVGSFLRRLFCGILARRMGVITTHFAQRGFKRTEGCALHTATLKATVSDYISKRRALSYVFLDVAKAFDSVDHQALFEALKRASVPRLLVDLVRSMYDRNTTKLNGINGPTITITRGVLQGDPLSPILFNLVMEAVRSNLNPSIGARCGDETVVSSLLFADDVVLFGESLDGLQSNVDAFAASLRSFGLNVNARKCAAVHIRPTRGQQQWYVAMNPTLKVNGREIKNLSVAESYKYLGVRLRLDHQRLVKLDELTARLKRVSKSFLKPQQRLAVLKRNLLPALEYELSLGAPTQHQLRRADRLVRSFVKRWLHLPKDVPNSMLHGEVKNGGLGVPCLRTRIPRLQLQRCERIEAVEERDPIVSALVSHTWWKHLKSKAERLVEKLGHEKPLKLREANYWHRLLYETIDGKGLKWHGEVSYSNNWINFNNNKLSGKEFVSAVHARCNTLATRSRSNRGSGRTIHSNISGNYCTQCKRIETLQHIAQVCGKVDGLRIKRHDQIVNSISRCLKNKGLRVLIEPRIPVKRSFVKPDIVAYDERKAKVWIIDPTVVSTLSSPSVAHQQKVQKYSTLAEVERYCRLQFKNENLEVETTSATINWRGAWAPESVRALSRTGIAGGLLSLLSFKVCKAAAHMFYVTRLRTDW